MTIIEEAPEDLASQILYWDTVRKQNAIAHHARSEGYTRLGLQPLPTLQQAEHNGKQAITMGRLLRSLQQSPYAGERWTLADCSAEVVLHTEPKRHFKKGGVDVEVWYDNNRYNAMIYTMWKHIYSQDENGQWYKTESHVDHNGLWYRDHFGDAVYYTLFASDVDKYGVTGTWTVVHDNKFIYAPVTSTRRAKPAEPLGHPSTSTPRDGRSSSPEASASNLGTSGEATPRVRRRQRESRSQSRSRSRSRSRSPLSKRQRPDTTTGRRGGGGGGGRGRGGGPRESAPAPSEVGQRLTSVTEKGLSRLHRLQQEARDPPVILVQGPANTLKCWRRRFSGRHSDLFTCASSVFRWIAGCGSHSNRLLIAFRDAQQRVAFLHHTTLPKHCSFTLGSFDKL